MTPSESLPNPYAEILATVKKLQGDAYRPILDQVAANMMVPNISVLESAAFRESCRRMIAQVRMDEDAAKGIQQISRSFRVAQGDWKRTLLAIQDQHRSILEQLNLPQEAEGSVDDVPSVDVIDEEFAFAVDSLPTDEDAVDDGAISPMGVTRHDWQMLFLGQGTSDLMSSLDYVTPHLSLVIFLVAAFLLMEGTDR